MNLDFLFVFNSILLGVGLAMDAFSVSAANGLNDPKMKAGRMNLIAGTFSFFQFLMPMLGWVCVHTIIAYFKSFQKLIPWIALILLVYIGGSMIHDALKNDAAEEEEKGLTIATLLLQGIATSIDALSVGFTIADYDFAMALISALIIAVVTYLICLGGLCIGKTFGTRLAGKANILGGVVLIFIGIEIFVKGVLF